MDRKASVELTNLCLIYDGDKILVEEREWNGEKGIIFPGGHVEANESLTDSVIREMKEETGLTIEHPALTGLKGWINEDGSRYIVLLYKTDRFSGELRSSDEGRVFWTTRDEFDRMNVIWDMKETLKVIDSDEFNELFVNEANEKLFLG